MLDYLKKINWILIFFNVKHRKQSHEHDSVTRIYVKPPILKLQSNDEPHVSHQKTRALMAGRSLADIYLLYITL